MLKPGAKAKRIKMRTSDARCPGLVALTGQPVE